jgi:Cd2+/Zn2+-exporting ATPase
LRAAITAGVLLALGFVLAFLLKVPQGEAFTWASLAIGMLYGGKAAWESLRQGKFDIDVLMIVGGGLAAGLGHPAEGALLLFLFVLAGALEDRAMQRTKREIEALHKLMPTVAILFRDNDWAQVTPEELKAGDRIKVRPGDRVPTDARVLSGETSIDQSAITGESMPRTVKPGDDLYAGTINTDDAIEATVTRPASESSLQKILNLVTEAREQREPVQRIIDRVSQPYSIGVIAISIAVLLVWWLGLGRELKDAAYTAITLLIVASPCALVIATPTATLSAIARAARQGVLFKGGQSIERLANIGSVCFDKTGTLTFGRPKLSEVHPVAWSDGKELLAMAAGLEADSTHPIAQAIRDAAKARGIDPTTIDHIDHVVGRGISGTLGSCPVRLGSYKHTEELIPICFRARVQDVLKTIQTRGHIGVVVSHSCPEKPGGGEAAVLIMSDAVRPGAATLVRDLHALNVRPVRMLTGDNRHTAERVGNSLGIDIIDAELLPQDKVAIVRSMKKDAAVADHAGVAGAASTPAPSAATSPKPHAKRRGVAVIGDGVNDAPALAAADVSIAIGSIGTDAALETADIVLLSDDLAVVPWAVRLARRARQTVWVNLSFALGAITIMAIITLVGSLRGIRVPMSVGVLAHEGGTLLVVANSLRMLLFPGPAASSEAAQTARTHAAPAPVEPAPATEAAEAAGAAEAA